MACMHYFSSCRGSANLHHLGHGSDDHILAPRLVAGLAKEHVTKIAVGAHHVMTLAESGNVHVWGKDSNKEVNESVEGVSLPKLLPEASNQGVVYIACGPAEVSIPSLLELMGA